MAFVAAELVRSDLATDPFNWKQVLGYALAACVLQLVFGLAVGLYGRTRFSRIGGFDEAFAVAVCGALIGVVLWAVPFLLSASWRMHANKVLMATLLVIVFMFALRYAVRVYLERSNRPGLDSTPTIVYGAGYIGNVLVQWMLSESESRYRPVALLDDARQTHNRRIRGVQVYGGFDQLESTVQKSGAEVLIVAIKDADTQLFREVQERAQKLGIKVKVIGSIDNLVQDDKPVKQRDLRDLRIEDLLGRKQVDTDLGEIASYISGRRVLVTGAGGSIGSQLCAEIAKFRPSELMMLDRDETGLQSSAIAIEGNGLLATNSVILADIRDADRLKEIFFERQPEVIFHAAALKHLPMLEQYPEEGWKSNVEGTLNVLEAARLVNVDTFINISTDKAANPTSALGHSKRYAEKLTAWFGETTGKNYLSVRFGNVIGSRGSMVPTFMRLIEEDKPLTVTHPEATRYFMTIPEACQLVLQAGGIGKAGEVLILDMGEPMNILSIAQQMIEISGKDIEIVFTGLRPGEKLHEVLVDDDERANRPYHPLISHAHAERLDPADLDLDEYLEAVSNDPGVREPQKDCSK
ncbi:polysaccharide biosynthesis protein [Corynebacterium lubricantis]|uniref:polysaccharide biosynthesis protein n=1 Tax=Corynebacterium lubricantis TaxID=541095 RepID=UPI001FE10A67|nr:nucleoside-diphosphate sugar epimerase/dehydratase [Corynebacterium lubricantis]